MAENLRVRSSAALAICNPRYLYPLTSSTVLPVVEFLRPSILVETYRMKLDDSSTVGESGKHLMYNYCSWCPRESGQAVE